MACTMAKQGAQSLLPTTDIAPAQMIIKIRSTCLFIERSHSTQTKLLKVFITLCGQCQITGVITNTLHI